MTDNQTKAAKAAAREINKKWSADEYDIEEFSERDAIIIQHHTEAITAEKDAEIEKLHIEVVRLNNQIVNEQLKVTELKQQLAAHTKRKN